MKYLKFFNYPDYTRVKDLFFRKKDISYDKVILRKIINDINTHSYEKTLLDPVFEQLMKFFSSGHAFYYCWGEAECCKFINNWLNMKLIKPYGLSETIFNNFNEFMKYYHKHKHASLCKDQIYLIDEQKVRNMKNLYELYDKYTDLERRNNTEHNKLPCTEYDSLITGYNNFIRIYRRQNIDYLNKLLNEFKAKIERFESISKNKCVKKDDILSPVEPPLPPKGDSANEQVDVSQPKEQTIPQSQETRAEESHVSTPHQETNYVGSGHQIAQGTLTQEKLEKPPRETERSRHFGNTIGTELRSNSDYPLDPNPSYQLMEELDGDNPSRLPGFPSRDLSTDQRDKEGYFSTMTDTISGFMKNVEPAPILGVSGGMGVLFLLFKVFKVLKL
ncbi:hypothetical protein PVBG_05439 [Plasmodium vivax Brazil I]|uniref:VIR protein n=1 Tax=Plasmodium vivax (strain Brazil I) TaxID=1033975 RepID=A0A0J9T0C2_PLAV1|nr:hypothetical protein PVBG_05439 [Plasmodium vivax Brazil I]